MPNYLRNYVAGGCYFFTIVTHRRIGYFESEKHKHMLLVRIRQIEVKKSLRMLAYCILPDHIHLLMQLPDEESNFSYVIRELKRLVTLDIRKEHSQNPLKVWQDRYWEHTIRDEKDLARHVDYIHFNPVKHGYVDDASVWPWSSYPAMAKPVNASSSGMFDHDDGFVKFYFGE